jgi:hypothetical protein
MFCIYEREREERMCDREREREKDSIERKYTIKIGRKIKQREKKNKI